MNAADDPESNNVCPRLLNRITLLIGVVVDTMCVYDSSN